MVDWEIARRIAGTVAGTPPGTEPLPGDLAALCRECEARVTAYARLAPATPVPPPEEVDRGVWLDANLAGIRETLEPIIERTGGSFGALAPVARAAAGTMLAAEAGALGGYLAQRVLGQYEVRLMDPSAPARLLFVGPNIVQAAERLEAPLDEVLAWIALHEVTHGVQFTGVPWLREHVAALLHDLLDSLDVKLDPSAMLRLPTAEDVRALLEGVREQGLAGAMGPERKAMLDRVQAVMAVVEGHAEHVMDATGEGLVPGIERLRGAMDRRRRERPPLLRLLERLIGLEMKLRQYEIGKRFCDEVVAAEGIEGFNRVWTGPDALPTLAELEAPAGWLARTA